jgi:hypothetical protein
MSKPDDCPPDVIAALARALADDGVRGRLPDDAEGALRGAGVAVERLPGGALDAIRSAGSGELDEIGAACRTVLAYSGKVGLGSNCFL